MLGRNSAQAAEQKNQRWLRLSRRWLATRSVVDRYLISYQALLYKIRQFNLDASPSSRSRAAAPPMVPVGIEN